VTLVPSKIGAEPKKLAILGGLLAAALIVYLINRGPSAPAEARTSPLSIGAVDRTARPAVPSAPRSSSRAGVRAMEDFKPSLKPKEGVDISKIDPTLKLDLLAKLNGVPLELGSRGSVFDWGKAPPPPPPPAVKVQPGALPTATNKPPESGAPKPDAAPPPPPIPLKFYGFSTKTGAKRAFFLDGDDIDVAAEDDVIKNRYKVIRIGVNSVVVEDLNFKHQQTLPLIEELAG